MLLKPSHSLAAIEDYRTTIRKSIERLKKLYPVAKEYNITIYDYKDEETVRREKLNHYSWEKAYEYGDLLGYLGYKYFLKFLTECEKVLKTIDVFNQQKIKPQEATTKRFRDELVCWIKDIAIHTEYFTVDLDKELSACELYLDKFKSVCCTLIKYGVSDSDYINIALHKQYSHSDYNLGESIGGSTDKERLEEALDIANIIETSYKDYVPYKKVKKVWWYITKPVPMDDNLKTMFNRLVELYTAIVGF